MRRFHRAAMAALFAVLAGCGDGGSAGDAAAGGGADATGSANAAADAATADTATLRTRAADAMRAGRLHSPAGDSAIDHYLALRTRDPQDAAAAAAVVELQPYLLIGAEQALAARRVDDASRLVGLLRASDPAGPALSRLDLALSRLRTDLEVEAAQAEAAAEAAANAPVPSTAAAPSPAPVPPTVPGAPTPAAVAAATPTQAAAPAPVPPAAPPEVPATGSAAPAAAPVQTRAPTLIASRPPRYPAAATARRIEGRVRMLLTVGAAGEVTGAQVISAEPAGVFEDSALATVRQYRFDTGDDGRKVMHTIAFSLRGAAAE